MARASLIEYLPLFIILTTGLPTTVFGLAKLPCPTVCDKEACEPLPVACPGLVLDPCNCCTVCSKSIGERCSLVPFVNGGVCGKNLECRLRDDLPPDEIKLQESLCYCNETEPVCGSNGINYDNICELTKEKYRLRDSFLKVAVKGICHSAPMIYSTFHDISDYIGKNVVLTCEVKGNPTPVIEWSTNKTGELEDILPARNESHINIISTGEMNKYEVTSWLQFRGLKEGDGGHYFCNTLNALGRKIASVKVNVIPRWK